MPDARPSENLCKVTCDLEGCTEVSAACADCDDFDEVSFTCKADMAGVELRRQDSLVMKLGKKVQTMLANMAEAPVISK